MALAFFLVGLPFGTLFYIVGLQSVKNVNERHHPTCSKCDEGLNLKVLLFGQCQHCGRKFILMHFLTISLTAVLFLITYFKFGFQVEIVLSLLFIALLMVILVSDLTHMIIPNKVLLFFLPIFIMYRILYPLDPWWSSVLGALIGFVIILIFIIVSRGAIGAGDMKLFGLLGIVLGVKNILLTFILSTMIGAVVGLILLVFKLINPKQETPFGPYIVIGSLIAYFYGSNIIQWYGQI